MEPPEVRRWIDPELVGQDLARPLKCTQRLTLSTGAIQREHQLRPEASSEWVGGGESLEFPDDLALLTDRELGVDAVLERPEPEIVETSRLGLQCGVGGEVGQRGPAPESEGVIERPHGGPRVDGKEPSRVAQERLESRGIELRRILKFIART